VDYLRDAAPGDLLDDVYVLTNKQLASSQSGKYFIKCFVSDSTSQVVARMWNATREIFNWIPDSGFVKVRGRIENYQNNLQFIIESVGPATQPYDIAELIPHTKKEIPEMYGRLCEIMGSLQNRHLAALIDAYLADAQLMEQFRKAPAAMSFHHAYIGGLLEHTLNAIQVADAIVPFYPGLNRDLVLAGIFLHDIAKTWELCYDCAFGYTDGGQLVGHIVKSAIWVEHKARIAETSLGEKIPQPLIDVIQHIIISHHGTPEFGAVKVPITPEALAVHIIENMDAKMMIALRATREMASGEEANWSEYVKALGGKLYRPDVAPADAPLSEEIEPPAAPAITLATPLPQQPLQQPVVQDPPAPVEKPMPTLNNPHFQTVRK
jgi:3'-5' exoribonuclease